MRQRDYIFEIPFSNQQILRLFAKAYLCFLVSALAKKNAEAIKFLGILKKTFPKIKYFCL